MSKELIEELRFWNSMPDTEGDDAAFRWLQEKTDEAADTIERLERELVAAKEEIYFQACLTKELLPYQERAAIAEQQRDELLAALEDAQDIASKTAQKAWSLGQTYWQQVDSEYQSQWKKADETQAKFQQVVDDARSAIARVKESK